MLFPIAALIIVTFFLAWPVTRHGMLMLLSENYPIENLSAIFLLAGGLRGAKLAWRAKALGEAKLCFWFYGVFAFGLLLTAMEEVAWGQKLFDFPTPSAWKVLNAQGETTLHNIHGLQGHSELFRITFGLGGLVGVWAEHVPYFRKIAAPRILLSWFLVITVHSAVDLFNDVVPLQRDFDTAMYCLSELIEMLIGIAGFLYVEINGRRLAKDWRNAASREP